MNAILTLLVAALASIGGFVIFNPSALRRLAAWSLARAMYVECLKAERERLQDERFYFHEARLVEFGLQEAAPVKVMDLPTAELILRSDNQ